jgi:hypothetical protein
MAATQEQQNEWRARLERLGEVTVRSDLQLRQGVGIGFSGDEMLQVAFNWLRQKEQEREIQERLTFVYIRWTLVAAIAAVLTGVAGLIATIFLSH